jgi:glycosyltransferase involved in cell wall biosynthesis
MNPIKAVKKNSYDALYISYDGILEPLGKSQVVPYLKQLSKAGIKFILLSFEKRTRLARDDDTCRVKRELDSAAIQWRRLRYHKKPAVISTLFDVLCGCLYSIWLVKKYKIKVIHARSYTPSLIAVILNKIFKTKFIFDMRGFWANERVEAGIWKNNGWLYKASKHFEKTFLLKADLTVALTRAAKEEIKKYPYLKNMNTDIRCIPTCVNLDIFKYKQCKKPEISESMAGKLVMIYSGSISTWFMPYQMIDFFNAAIKKIPQAHLLVLTKENELFESILKGGSLKNCFFSVANVDYELVPEYLSLGRVGLAFYKPGYSRKACCPTKLGEYLACGLPVVINSGVGDTEEILKAEGVGAIIEEFTDKEYERVSSQLRELLSDDSLKNRCRKVAGKYFSLDYGIQKYQEIYNRILKE